MFVTVPRAVGSIVAVSARDTDEPGAIRTVVATSPVPETFVHELGAVAVHVHVALTNAAGRTSMIAAPMAVDGPPLDTVIEYVVVAPAPTVLIVSSLVAESATRLMTLVSTVPELFWAFLSAVPDGGATVAIFVSAPTKSGSTAPVMTNVALLSGGRVIACDPDQVPDPLQDAALVATQVNVAPASTPAGNVSVTEAAVAVDGPSLVTTSVYVTTLPAIVPLLTDLVTARSANGVSVSVSVDVLSVVSGSTAGSTAPIDAVLASEPLAPGLTVPVIVNVALPPANRLTAASTRSPVPPAGQVLPADARHVHVEPVRSAGIASLIFAAAGDGPALLATTLYVVGVPGTMLD